MYSGLNEADTFDVIKVQNTTIDDLYVSSNLLYDFNWVLPNNWDFQIILHALFNNGSLDAGNVNFRNASSIILKKRIKGTFDWKTIYEEDVSEKDTSDVSALNIKFDDYLEPNNTEIEYAYTAIINGRESEPVLAEVKSKFYCYYLIGQCDDTGVASRFPAMFNINHQVQLNRQSNTVVSPGSKYPYVINNGSSKYYSGNFSVTFMPHDDAMLPVAAYRDTYTYIERDEKNKETEVTVGFWNPNQPAIMRNNLDAFLTDGYPKILKTIDGDMYMAAVVGNISRNNGQHYENIGQSWEWAEVGDPNDCGDLYDYGFINTDIGRHGG